MSSILRLGLKERSSASFWKSDGTNSKLDPLPISREADFAPGKLPNITRLDTTSFVNLFDRFNSLEGSLDDNYGTATKDFARDVGSPSTVSGQLHQSTAIMASNTARGTAVANTSQGNTPWPARNDSTGSTSTTTSYRSDQTSPMTRHSSSSSIMQAVSPLSIDQSEQKPTDPVGEQTTTKTINDRPTGYRKPKRAGTDESTLSSSSQLNLDKPLPAGPPVRMMKLNKSTTALVQSPQAPELPSTHHTRSTSVSLPLLCGSADTVPDLPVSSKNNTRGARLGRALAQPNQQQHRRSKSATFPAGFDFARSPILPQVPPKANQSILRKQLPHVGHSNSWTAEHVIYRIMCHLDDATDLKNTTMVSKGFLRTYRRNQNRIVSHLIFKNSRPAWETRRSILTLKGSRSFRLCDYQRDLRTIAALKQCILAQCDSICRTRTIDGLTGEDKQKEVEINDALWRVWTFCALFGDNATQSRVPSAEIDWLNGSRGTKSQALSAGFAVGNNTGLSSAQLEDMNEMWQCLQMLVSQYHGRHDEAKQAGVFGNWHLSEKTSEHHFLLEWTSYLLTLGPQVILTLAAGSFDKAEMLGLTRWGPPTPGQSRSTFLTAAISHVYQERILAEATARAAQITLPPGPFHRPPGPKHRPSRSMDIPQPQAVASRQQSLKIDTQNVRRKPLSAAVARSAPPVEIKPDCDPSSTPAAARSVFFPATPTSDPTLLHSLSMTTNASVRLGATLFPVDYQSTTPRVPIPQPQNPPHVPEVIDPIDKHLKLLVEELGFKEANAKRALAMCDSGSGFDIHKAIELLALESRRHSQAAMPIELPTPSDIVSPLRVRRQQTRKDFCTGECKRTTSGSSFSGINTSLDQSGTGTLMSKHKRNKSTGDRTVSVEVEPISPITDIYGGHSDEEPVLDTSSVEWRREEARGDTISPLMSPSPMMSVRGGFGGLGRRMTGKSAKAWRVLGVEASDGDAGKSPKSGRTRSKSGGVVGMEEYERRVERKRSMRMMQAQAQMQKELYGVGKALSENLKGLSLSPTLPPDGFGPLGGLGGLRQVVPEKRTGMGVGVGLKVAGTLKKSKFRADANCMAGSPC